MPQSHAQLRLVVTNTLIVRNIERSVAFYRDVLGAAVLREGAPTFLRLGNIWLTIKRGGGPTTTPGLRRTLPSSTERSHSSTFRARIRWAAPLKQRRRI